MRGRSLNDAFIILDEAQNTSPEQMKMFLTRLGFGSKIVVTGDVTQVDLPSGTKSGLRVIEDILDGVEDISFNRLTATTSYATSWSARSSRRTTSSTRAASPRRPPASRAPSEHRDPQRVRPRARRRRGSPR